MPKLTFFQNTQDGNDSNKLYPLGIAAVRAFAKKVQGEQDVKHMIVTHTNPTTNLVLNISVITEEGPSSEIGICDAFSSQPESANKLEVVEKNTIKGLKSSTDGIVKILVLFDDKVVRHAIQVNAYEDR